MFMRCDDQRWCDMFAGSGAMGLEALSRGAKEVIFIENDSDAFKILTSNILTCRMQSKSVCYHGDAFRVIHQHNHGIFDVIVIDPPYDMPLKPIIDLLLSHSWYDKNTYFVIERRFQENLDWLNETFNIVKQRKVGQSQYVIAQINV